MNSVLRGRFIELSVPAGGRGYHRPGKKPRRTTWATTSSISTSWKPRLVSRKDS